jgi:pyridoxal phosphate enzyme (YggS family)
MHKSIKNFEDINKELNLKVKVNSLPKIIAVSKTFPISEIMPLIEYGHVHFGENKVQEAVDKWSEVKIKYPDIKLHLIGKLQTNKVKFAVKCFDYIHSIDNEKLAKKIADEQIKQSKNIKLFIQVNIGNEDQKSGISKKNLKNFYSYCKDLSLNIVGLMCIPPVNDDPKPLFDEMNDLKNKLNLKELSMGMSADYVKATKSFSTYLRIGSKIFGLRN